MKHEHLRSGPQLALPSILAPLSETLSNSAIFDKDCRQSFRQSIFWDRLCLVSSRILSALAILCLTWLCASCATQPHLVLDPVGPPSATTPLDFVGIGFLKVYSATETREVGKFINYYPHTPYTIYSTNGQKFRWVENS